MKKKGKTLEERIQYLEDIHEIKNVMGKYEYMLTGGKTAEIADQLFVEKTTPGLRVDYGDLGVYEGERVYELMYALSKVVTAPGILAEHTLTTPIIEVAGDGKTARGVWISPGHEVFPIEGKLTAHWTWCKYDVVFIKQDGEWKIWRFDVIGTFYTSYDKSWVEAKLPSAEDRDMGVPKPDRPTARKGDYSPEAVVKYDPVPPEPYETFEE